MAVKETEARFHLSVWVVVKLLHAQSWPEDKNNLRNKQIKRVGCIIEPFTPKHVLNLASMRAIPPPKSFL